MRTDEIRDPKTIVIKVFSEYAGITVERSTELLEKFYNQYVPRSLRNDIFWLSLGFIIEREYKRFYKPKDIRKEFLYLLEKVKEE